ncbi:MAG TPA: peptidylprolyl isomerase [Chthoniobacterales bacterium]|nr:peptidylprolyl isomerase [Chthoniobacterales bacterium]
MSKLRLVCLLVAASSLGLLCSEFLCRSTAFRDAAGRVFGRGRLLALAEGKGIYERDLDKEGVFTARDLVARESLRRLARNEPVDSVKLDQELSLLRAQFGDDQALVQEARSSGFSIQSLRDKLADQLRSLQWLENQVTPETAVTEKECRDFFEAHRPAFAQPVRFRASHAFLAVPADTPAEIVESKQEMIDALAGRLAGGETLSQLAAEASEDEATKWRGGDLGFFASARMPADFFAEVEKLAVGQRSKPFRSHLGFHIVEVTEIRPARVLGFDEARGDISVALANERRALIAERLADMLSTATYARAD